MSIEDDIIKAIEEIPGVIRVDQPVKTVPLFDGKTLMNVILYFPTAPPDLEIRVNDNIGVEAKPK